MQKKKMPCPVELNGDPTGYKSKGSSVLAFGGDPHQRLLNLNYFWEAVLKAFISWPRTIIIIWGFNYDSAALGDSSFSQKFFSINKVQYHGQKNPGGCWSYTMCLSVTESQTA